MSPRLVPLSLISAAIIFTTPAAAQRAQSADCAMRDSARFGEHLGIEESVHARFHVEIAADGLDLPWGMVFLSSTEALITEKHAGCITRANLETGHLTPLQNAPAVYGKGGAGMLDIELHPDYRTNGWIYFSYSIDTEAGTTLVVDRARLDGDSLAGRERLFTVRPAVRDSDNHHGGRLALKDGYLFITMGERYDLKEDAQGLDTHHGKVIRIFDDGRVPEDNPFVNTPGALPEIWSLGHRNPQGMTLNPLTGVIWEHEHGPKGGDEINIIRRGVNYGWPAITYGREYSGEKMGNGLTRMDGMAQPVYYYIPSIAPSGMDFYTGDAFPGWKGNLFIGAMAKTHLNRLVLEDNRIAREERLLGDFNWRVRAVREGPDGFLYLAVDEGLILRLRPAGIDEQ